MGFWNGKQGGGVQLTDEVVRHFRKKYKERLANGEERVDVERDITAKIGNSRESVRMMLRGESYKWVSEWSDDELARITAGGVR